MSQRNPLINPKMKQEFFTNLPSEMITNILSRLPVRSIASCKCVCKSWRDLIDTHEFAKSHHSESVPGLAIFQSEFASGLYKIFEFEDGLNLEHHVDHYKPVTEFDFPNAALIAGSASGLLFLRYPCTDPDALYICNPITRDYIEIHCPQDFACSYPLVVTYGFGASKMTSQHKVVRIFQDCIRDKETCKLLDITESKCQVYTLGMGSWRSIAPCASFEYSHGTHGAFLNGNLHWLVYGVKGFPRISCIDLETENFSTFSSPTLPGRRGFLAGPFALGDCLCLCDDTSDDGTVIWLMKEYGVEKSWTKEFVIKINFDEVFHNVNDFIYPIKVFKDGDILMAWQDRLLFCYSSKTGTAQYIDNFELHGDVFNSILYTPSFLSLKSFGTENVSSL